MVPVPSKPLSSLAETLAAPALLNIELKSRSGTDLTQNLKDLVKLSQEQGYLTFEDVHEALPDHLATQEDLAEAYKILGNLDVEINQVVERIGPGTSACPAPASHSPPPLLPVAAPPGSPAPVVYRNSLAADQSEPSADGHVPLAG